MQSRKMKRVCDYALGEHVKEFGISLGRVAAVVAHPSRASQAFVLVVNKENEFSIYKGLMTVKCGLKLARNIPESVAIQLSGVILGGEPPAMPKAPAKINGKKAPVPIPEPQPEPKPEVALEEISPYFDFV